MTGQNFASYIRELTYTNSSTLTDATIVLIANVIKDDFATEIIKANEDLFGMPATRDLVASSSSDVTRREYTLPEDLLQIKEVEAKLDGTNVIRLREVDYNTYKKTRDESAITTYFANEEGKAFYEIFRRSLWILSGAITATTDGLSLLYIMYPADISISDLSSSADLSLDPTTVSVGLPRQFHELWARKVSILWKSNREKPIPLNERELKFDQDFESKMRSISNPNLDRSTEGVLPYDRHLQY